MLVQEQEQGRKNEFPVQEDSNEERKVRRAQEYQSIRKTENKAKSEGEGEIGGTEKDRSLAGKMGVNTRFTTRAYKGDEGRG